MIRLALLFACLFVGETGFLLAVTTSYAGDFSETERSVILSLGPWPPTPIRDSSNQASGNADAIALGEKLFFDRGLSKGNLLSCADCHQPDQNFADTVSLNRGHGKIDRHTPSVFNLRWSNWFGWGGEADSLWAQSIRPVLSATEMAATPAQVKNLLGNTPALACRFQKAFGKNPGDLTTDNVLVLAAKALAAFQETLVTGQTGFDRFRTALEAGDAAGIAKYPTDARRGLKIFAGSGRCTFCHFGPLFSNGEFGNIGVSHFTEDGRVDHGRYGGIRALKRSPWNLLGKYNDDPAKANAVRTRHVRTFQRNWGEFKVPSLRNVADTPPYMHNGSIQTLADVIEFYSSLDEDRLHTDGEQILRPLNLNERGKTDLLAFLQTLSAPVRRDRVPTDKPDRCPGIPAN